jgi:cell division septation protein DedD
MNRSPYTDDDLHDDPAPHDREISLGTPTILGIFFALAILCACIFGIGYTMGRKSAQPATALVDPAVSLGAAAKPAAGSPANQPYTPAPTPPDAAPDPAPSTPAAATPAPTPAAPTPTPTPPAAAPQPASSSPPSATVFMVQVAAVSSQDVADIELAALQKKGYNVAVHHEPQDQLLHIQIGPFATRAAAEAMRQRVLADGFNAIVK